MSTATSIRSSKNSTSTNATDTTQILLIGADTTFKPVAERIDGYASASVAVTIAATSPPVLLEVLTSSSSADASLKPRFMPGDKTGQPPITEGASILCSHDHTYRGHLICDQSFLKVNITSAVAKFTPRANGMAVTANNYYTVTAAGTNYTLFCTQSGTTGANSNAFNNQPLGAGVIDNTAIFTTLDDQANVQGLVETMYYESATTTINETETTSGGGDQGVVDAVNSVNTTLTAGTQLSRALGSDYDANTPALHTVKVDAQGLIHSKLSTSTSDIGNVLVKGEDSGQTHTLHVDANGVAKTQVVNSVGTIAKGHTSTMTR